MMKILLGFGLVLAAVYLAVRLLELDRINRETPSQDDPLLGEDEERHG